MKKYLSLFILSTSLIVAGELDPDKDKGVDEKFKSGSALSVFL